MWRPMTEHKFPWEYSLIIVCAFDKDNREMIDIFSCKVGEHGALFTADGSMMSLNEQGWIPFAWQESNIPERNDSKFPPMWHDYLTKPDGE